MTETYPADTRLWRVRWSTLNGQHRAALYCTEHKQRHESACVSLGLPRPAAALSTAAAGRCRQCPGGPGTRGNARPIFDRARRVA